jgi:hypothetical protein
MTTLQAGLIWSAGGFVVGFLVCWMLVRLSVIRVVKSSVPPGDKGQELSVKWRRRDKLQAALGIFILLMGVLASYQYYSVTSCQTRYNAAVAEALSQRSEAQRVTSFAQIKLLTTRSGGDPAVGLRAVEEYIQALRDLEEVRAATPYPKPADCGVF